LVQIPLETWLPLANGTKFRVNIDFPMQVGSKQDFTWQMGPSFQANLSFLPQTGSYGLGKLGKIVFALGKLVKPYFPKANRLKISNMCTLTFPKVEIFIEAKFYKLKLNPFANVPSFLRN
jgi:hypothetical protein